MPNAIAKAGTQTRVGMAFDCGTPDHAPIVWSRADHGTTSVIEGIGPQCGRPSMKLSGIFYTSEPGFKGTDKVYILGFLSNGKNIDDTLTVLVK